MSRKFTKEDFIIKANTIHGDKYDYSLVDYKDSYTKVKIICKEHGVFEQQANSHLQGSGCKICRNELLSLKRRSNKEEFIKKAKLIHNNKYDYELIKYVNTHTKIKITCPIHGEFEQSPANHLKGHECKKCGDLNTGRGLSQGKDLFVENSKIIHNNKYDYSLVNYKNNQTKVIIKCDNHGVFEQYPGNHIHKKQGCPLCIEYGFSKVEREVSDFINDFTNVELNTKINNLEFDILCKNEKLAFEFNGLFWHSDKFKNKNYHLNKTIIAEKK